jgi:hypothetical protein
MQYCHQGEFKAKGLESNTPFAAIDLSEGEWYDYDDKAGEEVSIKDIKWEIRRAWALDMAATSFDYCQMMVFH